MSYSVVIKMERSRAEFTKQKRTNRAINSVTFINKYIFINHLRCMVYSRVGQNIFPVMFLSYFYHTTKIGRHKQNVTKLFIVHVC